MSEGQKEGGEGGSGWEGGSGGEGGSVCEKGVVALQHGHCKQASTLACTKCKCNKVQGKVSQYRTRTLSIYKMQS